LLQVIRPKLLEAGFKLVAEQHLEVTDDVSIIEAMHEPVQITKGSYTNIKVRAKDSVPMSVGLALSCHLLDDRCVPRNTHTPTCLAA